jgi:hypothetical protein
MAIDRSVGVLRQTDAPSAAGRAFALALAFSFALALAFSFAWGAAPD